MNTDGGWITVSEAARLYGKSRKWVYDQIKRHQIGTEKTANRTRLRLVDLIAHRGEPQNGAPGNNGTPTVKGQIITPEITPHTPEIAPETEILKQENQFLRRRIEELEGRSGGTQAAGGTVAGDYRETVGVTASRVEGDCLRGCRIGSRCGEGCSIPKFRN